MIANIKPKTIEVNSKQIQLRQFKVNESELKSCLKIQHETWGLHAGDVPLNLLKINLMLGGLVAGAFDESGRCLGIIISMPGQLYGESAHWSYRLAVSPNMRELNLGKYLKEYQRECCKENSIKGIYWTYDPLQSKNAHFNINKLGCRVVEYQENFLPESSPELHLGMGGTDRFVVRWDVDQSSNPPNHMTQDDMQDDMLVAPIVTEATISSIGSLDLFRIEVPTDINAIKKRDPNESEQWRFQTRALFLESQSYSKKVVGFYRDKNEDRSFYCLR